MSVTTVAASITATTTTVTAAISATAKTSTAAKSTTSTTITATVTTAKSAAISTTAKSTTTATSTVTKTTSSPSTENQSKPAATAVAISPFINVKDERSSIRARPKALHSPKLSIIPSLTVTSDNNKDDREKLVAITPRSKSPRKGGWL
ncbi:transient-receptor-potential-like protein [Lasius niger]|uniref:Transient-receptor-potential-like protein n=2 Tax=Lasius TaxID=488720 RepID=A0A0J7KPT4_LASNI|nr:transient-receptor-potential-like protein [Lasius niger]